MRGYLFAFTISWRGYYMTSVSTKLGVEYCLALDDPMIAT